MFWSKLGSPPIESDQSAVPRGYGKALPNEKVARWESRAVIGVCAPLYRRSPGGMHIVLFWLFFTGCSPACGRAASSEKQPCAVMNNINNSHNKENNNNSNSNNNCSYNMGLNTVLISLSEFNQN